MDKITNYCDNFECPDNEDGYCKTYLDPAECDDLEDYYKNRDT